MRGLRIAGTAGLALMVLMAAGCADGQKEIRHGDVSVRVNQRHTGAQMIEEAERRREALNRRYHPPTE